MLRRYIIVFHANPIREKAVTKCLVFFERKYFKENKVAEKVTF